MTPAPPIEDRDVGPVPGAHPRSAQLVAIGASLALLALSFTTFYRYGAGLATREICTLDGGTPCPGTIATRTAWHGYPGWIAIVVALLGAACITVRTLTVQRQPTLARPLAWAAFTLYLLATAGLVFTAVAIPNLVPSLPDIARTLVGGGVTDNELVTNHLAWGYWVSLAVAVVGLAAAAMDVLPAGHRRPERDS
jgi:hypothetical protein